MKERLTDEQQRLAEEAWPYAMRVAASFARRFPHYQQEFESACGLAACEASVSFDPSRNVKLKTVVTHRSNGACLDALRKVSGFGTARKHRYLPNCVSLYTRVEMEYETSEIADTIPSEDEPIGWELESYDEVNALTEQFDPQVADAIRLWALHAACENSQRKVSEVMGYGRSRISQLMRDAKSQVAACEV